jgi:hypothetical protein
MTRIPSCTSQADICGWTRTNQEQIHAHFAWHGDVDAKQAESVLEGKDSFTYLLRTGEEENAYFITFVKEDLSIKHQRFTLEYDRKGWYYKNGGPPGISEIVSETLERLIPQMMHCESGVCKIVGNRPK